MLYPLSVHERLYYVNNQIKIDFTSGLTKISLSTTSPVDWEVSTVGWILMEGSLIGMLFLFDSLIMTRLSYSGGSFIVTLSTSKTSETMMCRLSNNHRYRECFTFYTKRKYLEWSYLG